MDTLVMKTDKNGNRFNQRGEEVVACSKGCGRDTTMAGTKLCDHCWEKNNREHANQMAATEPEASSSGAFPSAPQELPKKLCIKDGVLMMRDGSNAQEYLRSRPIANEDEVVLMRRADLERLVRGAHEAQLHRWQMMAADERFALAA